MSRQAAVNETIEVKVRLLPSGKIVLKSFDWQGRTHYVRRSGSTVGTNGRRTNAFAVSLCRRRTRIRTSLRWDPAEDEWNLHCAWLANLV